MDLIAKNTFRNWLLAILLVSNLLTISIIWMQTARTNEIRPNEPQPGSSESTALLKKTLGLDDVQSRQAETILAEAREQSKQENDSLTMLKRMLAEELFKATPDIALVTSITQAVGALQAKVEMIRYEHFHQIIAICTPEQRDKLKPIVVEVFGRKPPSGATEETSPPTSGPQGRPKTWEDIRPGQPGDQPPPPLSVDEKLAKYTEELHLSPGQAKDVRAVLVKAEQRGEQLRSRRPSEEDSVAREQESIRRDEDDSIMRLLDPEQHKEFERLLAKRLNEP